MKFSNGVKDGLPIGLGYFAVSFSFGIAGSKLLSWPLVTFISMTNLTSAGQFAGLQIMSEAAGTFIEMAIATFFINLRYSLMAISLSQKVAPSFGTFKRLMLATGITDEIYALAVSQSEPVTARYFAGLMVLPYFAGERTPIGDPNARGLVIGLTLSHTREHLYKAALEGIAYSIDQHVKLIEEDGVKVNKIMMVGGGTKNSAWLQIIADVLGREIHTAGVTIGAAFGDALMASLAAGFYESWEALSQVVKPAVTYRPDPAASAVYEKHKDLFVKLYIDNREHMHYLAR